MPLYSFSLNARSVSVCTLPCDAMDSVAFASGAPLVSAALKCDGRQRLVLSQERSLPLGSQGLVRGGYGIFYGGFENSALLTYNDFPFQFNLSYPNLTPNAPITFANGSIGTLETGLTGIPLTSAAAEPGGVSLLGEDYNNKTPYTQGYNLTLQ